MTRVAGVDGAQGGWAVVISENGRLRASCIKSFSEICERNGTFDIVAVDMPMGLLDRPVTGGRCCEKAARKMLGAPRASSVFSSPTRAVLAANSYKDACQLSRGAGLDARAISKQSFGILPKIREVDRFLEGHLNFRDVIHEVHPEISFYEMTGRSMNESKRRGEGQRARASALRKEFSDFDELIASWQATRKDKNFKWKLDDIIDATAACWTALRLARGGGRSLINPVPFDSNGLKMTIWV